MNTSDNQLLRRPAYSARAHLIAFGLMIAVPLLSVSGILIYRSITQEQAQLEQRLNQTADDLVNDIDRDLARHIALLRTLAALPAARDPDLSAFYNQAKEVVNELGLGIFLIDPMTLKVVLSTLRAYGDALPITANPDSVKRIMAGAPHDVSDMFVGAVSKRRVFDVSVPMLRDGNVRYVLTLTLEPSHVQQMLEGQMLDRKWVATIWDRNGTILARSRDHKAHVGRQIPEAERAPLPRVVHDLINLDNEHVRHVVAQSPLSNWSFAVNVPASEAGRQLRMSLLLLAVATIGGLFLAVGLASLFGRGIARPLALSSAAAVALGKGEPVIVHQSNLLEINQINTALLDAQRELELRQASLRHLAEQLSFAADAAEFGSYNFDIGKRTIEWSPHLKKLLGAQNVVGDTTVEVALSFLHPEDRPRIEALMKDVVERATEKYEHEFRIIRRDDGEVHWLLDRGGTIKGADGTVERAVGALIDISKRKAAEIKQQLLLQELNHRVKNTLAVVQSIAAQTARTRSDPSQFADAFTARIASLARSHDLLTRNVWQGATLRDAVEAAMTSFRADEGRIEISGPAVMLTVDSTVSLSLLLHELATNAAKYGCLSVPEGRLRIVWSMAKQGDNVVVDLLWEERGGPTVKAPHSQGFGSRLIKAIAAQLNGTVTLDMAAEGACCRLRFKVPASAGLAP